MNRRTLMLIVVSVFSLFSLSTYAGPAGTEKGGTIMHTYVIFFSFTAQGIENIKDSPARVEVAKEVVSKMGGEMKAFYGILGSQYDTMFILEAPDDEAVAKMVLAIASGGYVRTVTHRLFTNDEYSKLISELP